MFFKNDNTLDILEKMPESKNKRRLQTIQKEHFTKKDFISEPKKQKIETKKITNLEPTKRKLSNEDLVEKIEERKKKKNQQHYFDKLIECKSCKHQVNALAEICPNCGWKVISNQKTIQGLIGILFIGSFFYWLYVEDGFLYLFKIAFLKNFQ